MKKGWTEVALGDVCTFNYGKSLAAGVRSGSGHPVFGSNGQVGLHEEALTDGPTVVIGRKGSFGEVHWSDGPCWPIDTTYFVDRRSTSTDLRWLMHRLGGLGLTRFNRAAAVPGLNRDDAYRQRLLLPPLEEQKRIAAILDKADELLAKRRAAIAHLDSLTQAIFLDMFGDCDLPRVSVEEVAASHKGAIRTGPFGSQLLHSEFIDSGIAVLGIDNVATDRFAWGQPRFISPDKYEELSKYTVYPKDVLVTIMGTCGRVALVPDDIPTAINTKHLCCITVDTSRIVPEYLRASLLFDREVRKHLGESARGAVMPGLNMSLIKSAKVQLPSLEEQNRFVEQVGAAEAVIAFEWQSRDLLTDLATSLQARAFRGEL